jgi:hypothetical protein
MATVFRHRLTPEEQRVERERRARAAVRRAVWYLIVLAGLLYLIARPHALLRF